MATFVAEPVHKPSTRIIITYAPVAMIFLVGWCSFLFLYGLNQGEFYRTESLRAILAAEFLRSGDWIVPRLYGEPFLTKPPGMYAAIALVSLPVGEVREWTARLPSVLAACLLVFLFYRSFRRVLGWQAGLIAAGILPMSLMWLDKVPSAEIDMLQVAWVSAAILCFLRALELAEASGGGQPGSATNRAVGGYWWAAAILCVAGGTLTKWTAPAFFYITVITLLWWRGRLRLIWSRQHLTALLLCVGVCLAWIMAVASRVGWETFTATIRREALMHLSPQHHQGTYSWRGALAHPFVVWAAALPSSLAMLWALQPGFANLWDERGRRLLQALHCWVWPNLLFWSLIPGHSPRHSFPLVPGMVGLSAMVWYAWVTGRLRWPMRWRPASILLAGCVCWLIVKLVFVHGVIPARMQGRNARSTAETLASLVPTNETLHLCRLKDEGILFYYGRTVRRLPDLAPLLSTGEPRYAILDESEWRQNESTSNVQCLGELRDEQGAPIFVVRVAP